MTPAQAQARSFIIAKYGDDFLGYLSLWNKKTGKTRYFSAQEVDALVEVIERDASTSDLYLALGTQTERLQEQRRGGANTVAQFPGFVADIDFASAKDSQKNYPENEQEALEILSSFTFRPTHIVRTGNGLHVHFELASPVDVGSIGIDRAKQIWSGFQRALIAHFRKNDRDIDNVGDLARNYRIPGTLNHKASPPKLVDVIGGCAGPRLTFADVEAFLKKIDVQNHEAGQQRRRQRRPLGDHAAIVRHCAWYRNMVVEGAANCDEPNWYAGASITSRCKDGDRIFHQYSRKHSRYNEAEAAAKFARARAEAGPRTCENVRNELGCADCDKCPHWGQISSPIQLGSVRQPYNPGTEGPVPLGYTRDGLYALLDPVRNIIIQASANQLLSQQFLLGLASSSFWKRQFPGGKTFGFTDAGEALIGVCRTQGPFIPSKVRGRGIWLEGDMIVVNLGSPIPPEASHRYICFEPISLVDNQRFDVKRLLALLQSFKWRNPNDAILLLGWLAAAPICGLLNWRPHIFVYGPARCGKTTIHNMAAEILRPLVISTDGQSSEAGIRQTLGPDSLPVIIDEFESDQSPQHVKGVIRLARSASSADSPVFRGTPEGKAMQFSLRTAFFFSGINPGGMSPADESRIVLLEMLMHDNEPEVARHIIEEEAFFRSCSGQWCGYMVTLAPSLPPAIASLERSMPSADRRHRQNMATLAAGYFVALHGRPPTDDEARALAEMLATTVDVHAEALDRDDAVECLDYLFAHPVGDYPLQHWVAVACEGENFKDNAHIDNARRIVRTFDMVIRSHGDEPGLFFRNGSPSIDKVFVNTKWGNGAWKRALRKLAGAFSPRNPVYFGNAGGKSRCIGIPLTYIPEPYETPADQEKY